MESILNFVSIIIIVFGILQIILFFKVWGMTNDIKKIKDTVQANNYPTGASPAIIEFALGNVEKGKELAMKEFICEVYKLYSKVNAQVYTEQDYIEVFNDLEKKYKNTFESTSSFMEFSKFSTFDNAKKIFH